MSEFMATGVNGQITVTETKIIISRKGLLGVLGHGFKGDKEIRIDQISSIQLKHAGPVLNGYIQFGFLGSQESKSGIIGATQDENTVMFNTKQEPDFQRVKEHVEARYGRQQVAATASPLDDLERLAVLKDKGIITEAEFEAKKKQILGL